MKSKLEEFQDWIRNARTGKIYIYYTGHLAVDRGTIIDNGTDTPVFIPVVPVHELGKAAIDAFDAGRIHLFQRKLHDNVFQYIAMKKSPYGRQW